ncbi:MAG: transcription antitermination protein NusB [Flavobacteriales bacterium]
MISRRHIRLKVMQSLYAFYSKKDISISKSENEMLRQIQDISNLKLAVLSLFLFLFRHADSFFEDNKNKFLPKDEDLNPNKKFIDNFFYDFFLSNKTLMTKLEMFSVFWNDNDHDIIRKIFKDIVQSKLYNDYLNNDEKSYENDIKFFNNILNEIILNNEILHHILEEKSIYWIDDLPFVATIIMGDFKIKKIKLLKSVFKNSSDKDFAIDLYRGVIKYDKEYEKVIIDKAQNWDIERIAIMDQIMIKMAFCEILNMPELPVKVSLNEYIEISKYYSTNKSKMFINGLIDSAVKDFTVKKMIKKSGRGLM